VVRLEGIGLGMTPLERESWGSIAPIVEKMVENRLRWFGHVEIRPVSASMKSRSDGGESDLKR